MIRHKFRSISILSFLACLILLTNPTFACKNDSIKDEFVKTTYVLIDEGTINEGPIDENKCFCRYTIYKDYTMSDIYNTYICKNNEWDFIGFAEKNPGSRRVLEGQYDSWCPGVSVCELPPPPEQIPEFPTIGLPVVGAIGLMFLLQRKKGKSNK